MNKKHKQHKQNTNQIIEDNIFITGKKTGFIRQPDGDIEIKEKDLNTALRNDIVKIAVGGHEKQKSAKVIEITKRAKTKFVGTIAKDKQGYYLIPDDPKFYPHLVVGVLNLKIEKNVKVLVEMSPWDNSRENPQGKIVKVLGQKGEHNVEMESILLEKGFEPGFPAVAEKEAELINKNAKIDFEKEIKKRKDFRNVTTFTIDPDDAKDFDDALSFRELPDGNFEVGIHIADVTHFVKINSAIDKEAVQRCTSVYLVDRTIPMLPEVLSNNLCSLNPNEDKIAFSAVLVLDKDAEVKERWFGKTVINSDKRFSYKEAQEILDKGEGKFYTELKRLDKLARKIRKRRIQKGAINFGSSEIKFKLDANGKPIEVFKKELLETNELIEDFMLLANKRVAGYIEHLKKEQGVKMPFVYRVHDDPDPDQIKELARYLKSIGYHLNIKNKKVSPRDLNNLLEDIAGQPEENLIATAMLKSMTKAVYSIKNIGHFGLAFKHYTHFTSPIRRYPDMMVHRLMKKYLKGEKVSAKALHKYRELALKSTQQEIAAVDAERASVKYKFVEFMSEKVGEKFDGVISGITKWGVYVQVENGADGMISLRSLKDDYYELDSKNYRLIGQKTRTKYTLGDKIKVRLVKTDIDRKTIDFELV
ncbi:MAG: ribonuclease R [Candidatus Pacebacteria bacterium]|nr:ribonuclease R [Candidatus Paceibacterota bacterium]